MDDPLSAALTDEALTLLGETSRTWAPGAAKIAAALPWENLKLLSFDGLPAVGRTAHPRLFISAGHGPAGWAQALGSGKLIAELLSGATPSLPAQTVAALRPERFVH
jgi:D-amino-acid dehydrogenase